MAEHVTAGVPTVPVSVTRDDVPAALVDRERRIFTEQAAASGKPENIVQKMVEGIFDISPASLDKIRELTKP